MNERRYYLIILLLISSFPSKILAQSSNVIGLFPTIDHSGVINNRLEYSLYYFAAFPLLKFRQTSISNDAYFHLFYAEHTLNYKLKSNFWFTGSYVFQRANVVYNNFENENRFYLQAKYKHTLKKFNFTHRIRFDGRFIQNRLINKTPFTHRLRYLIGIDSPINNEVYLTAYEEVFFNTFKNASKVYAENWAYAAIGQKLNERNKLEAGILFVTWNIEKKTWFNQYYFQLTWINHIDKKK